ncbi:MAG: ABC transporter permease [Gammaproteobacteria bacterium]|nr:MAG: ABC transporter permease [Gammaproteobacteria bacterium]
MTRRLGVVFRKEILDNFRDRRSLTSAMLFGPLFGPVLFAVMISFALDRVVSSEDAHIRVVVSGGQHAPKLIEHLRRANADIVPMAVALKEAREMVAAGREDVILLIPETFGEAFRAGRPAVLQLVSDSANSAAEEGVRRVRMMLGAYAGGIGAMRLQARGVSAAVTIPIAIDDVDVSTPAARSVLLLGMMTYFIIFSMLMGGLYLAIDSTAGERERGSLEPLLTLPVSRADLIVGKILATAAYMVTALAVTLIVFAVVLTRVPLEDLGMTSNFGPATAVRIFVLMLPFSLLGAALMTCVASFTRSYKEAQTYLTVVLLVPTLPILFAALNAMRPSTGLMLVPSLSQHLVITGLMKAESVPVSYLLISFTSTLVLGLLLTGLATRLYRRESLLG